MVEMRGGAVRLRQDDAADALDELYERAIGCDGGVGAALQLAVDLGGSVPRPASGATGTLWEVLATIAAADPTVARVVEPHLDAVAILAELDDGVALERVQVDSTSTWGVFAAEGPGQKLAASEGEDGWRLSGSKPWCSLADRLTHALVTAHLDDGRRGLFAVRLRADGVAVREGVWVARGLAAVPSGPVDFAGAPAVPVGAPGWYLERPGFAWGGVGVAAIWLGAAVGIARLLDERARSREPDQIATMHLGAVDVAIWCGTAALRVAADEIDAGVLSRADAGLLANRTRTVVADVAEDVIRRVGHALGPAPLALDARHAGRVADLELYLRQHHAERDEAAVGRAVLAGDRRW